tara:strand:+ start:812 stop:1204 length:393 start_codon:yes stop_codon:yes gene_type:complete
MYKIYNNENVLVAESQLEIDYSIKELIEENDYKINYFENVKPISHEKIKVYNINKRPNQFLIVTPDAHYFQSYESLIAVRTNEGKIYLDVNYWDYSTTTGKYRNIFLNENKSLTQKKINSNVYSLVDLNN